MSTVSRHSNTCVITRPNNSQKAVGEVMSFNEGRNLTVVMNKSVKILMNWNGRCYEGRAVNMDFESEGPTVTHTKTASRG